MNINLKTKLQALIDQYKEDMAAYQERLRTELNHFNDPGVKRRYSEIGLKETIDEKIAELKADLEALGTTFNQKAKAIVDEAKEQVTSAVMGGTANRPADHAALVSNALNFLDRETGETLTDDVAYSILKAFTGDYDQMALFARIVEGKVGALVDADGSTTFPKTFGTYAKAHSTLQVFDEITPITEAIFTNPKYMGADGVTVCGIYHGLPMDGYLELANWATLLELAEKVDQAISAKS